MKEPNIAEIPAAMCTIDSAAINFFTSEDEREINDPNKAEIPTANTANSVERIPSVEKVARENMANFSPNAASNPEVGQLASTCASGSQKAVGNVGVFTRIVIARTAVKIFPVKLPTEMFERLAIPRAEKTSAEPMAEMASKIPREKNRRKLRPSIDNPRRTETREIS